MSLVAVIAAFQTGQYTITRTGAATWAGGVGTNPVPSTINAVPMVVFPVAGDDLKVMPQGLHVSKVKVALVDIPLQLFSAAGAADRIAIDGGVWEVVTCEKWDAFGETFYKAFLACQDKP